VESAGNGDPTFGQPRARICAFCRRFPLFSNARLKTKADDGARTRDLRLGKHSKVASLLRLRAIEFAPEQLAQVRIAGFGTSFGTRFHDDLREPPDVLTTQHSAAATTNHLTTVVAGQEAA
jgi:hypothetical protein